MSFVARILARVAPPAVAALLVEMLKMRFIRFLLTGGVNTVFGYAVYFSLLKLIGHAVAAMTLATIIGVIFNFFSTGRMVFDSRDHRLVGRFVLVYVVVYIYNAIGLIALQARGMDPAIAGLVLLPGAVAISWTLNKNFVFHAVRPGPSGAPTR